MAEPDRPAQPELQSQIILIESRGFYLALASRSLNIFYLIALAFLLSSSVAFTFLTIFISAGLSINGFWVFDQLVLRRKLNILYEEMSMLSSDDGLFGRSWIRYRYRADTLGRLQASLEPAFWTAAQFTLFFLLTFSSL